MDEKLVSWAEQLAQAISKAAGMLWQQAVEQSIVTGYYYLVLEVFLLAIAIYLIFGIVAWARKIRKHWDTPRTEDLVAFLCLLSVLLVIDLGFFIRNMYYTLTYLLNPEWGAILILKDLSGL